jgi:hypothetical protein
MKSPLPQAFLFLSLILIDFVLIVGIFIHGKANFTELFKHL